MPQLHVAASDPGHVEQVVDEPDDVLDLAFDDAALTVGADDAAQTHQLERREDRRQWIAQFVAEHRQEFVLRPVRRFGLTPRFGELGHLEADDGNPGDTATFGERLVDEVEERLRRFRPAAIEHDPHGATDIRLARREHAVEQLVEPLAAELRQRRADRFAGDRPCADHRQVDVVDELEHVLRPAKNRDTHRRVLEDTRQPAHVGFLDGSDLGAHHLRLDARDQFARGERLDQIVVRAGLQPLDAGFLPGARRHQDHRNRLCPLVGPQAAQQLEPVDLRHHDVGDDHVGTVRLG